MQVDPIKPTLKAPESKRLKLKRAMLLPTSAIRINLRRYNEDDVFAEVVAKAEAAKNCGNDLFKSGDFTSAEAAYSQAISFGRVRRKLQSTGHVTQHV